MDAFDKIARRIEAYGDEEYLRHPFYHYEPWDVKERDQKILDQALRDNIDLYASGFVEHTGKDPHPFQSGYHASTAFFRTLLAGTSVGKSYAAFNEMIMMLTGELPISLRYDKDQDSGVKRVLSRENIKRFGRRDSSTGEIIDYNVSARKPDTWEEWNCGTIIGVGKFPEEKIAPPGSEIWLGTFQKAFNRYWWPKFYSTAECMIPPHLIDTRRGNSGYNVKDHTVHLIRGCDAVCITYESGFERYEAKRVWACKADEEPKDPRIIQAMQQHCSFLSLVFTPYQGVTYTKRLIFPPKRSKEKKVFHACQYDSPYQDERKIKIMRQNMYPWEIGARLWGVHTEAKGEPYYDRAKINVWIQRHVEMSQYVSFQPEDEYFGIVSKPEITHLPGLMDVRVKTAEMSESDFQRSKSVWKMYEPPNPNYAYLMCVDTAEGAETEEEAGNPNAARVMRGADPSRKELRPVTVCVIRSILETTEFASEVSYGCRVYNNAVLAAETGMGFTNATFLSELRDYPHWFKMVTIRDSNRKPRTRLGFDTSAKTRSALFDLIGKQIKAFDEDENPGIPDEELLIELAGCVKGKHGRPDHAGDGTLDSAIAHGIGLYVFEHAPDQVVNNRDPDEKEREPFWFIRQLMGEPEEVKAEEVSLGENVRNWR